MARHYHSAPASPDNRCENGRNDGADASVTTPFMEDLPLRPDHFGLCHQTSGVTLIEMKTLETLVQSYRVILKRDWRSSMLGI
jgi:hypothetical protein